MLLCKQLIVAEGGPTQRCSTQHFNAWVLLPVSMSAQAKAESVRSNASDVMCRVFAGMQSLRVRSLLEVWTCASFFDTWNT